MAEKTVEAKENKEATKKGEECNKCNKNFIVGAIIGGITLLIAAILIVVFVVIKPFDNKMIGKYDLTGIFADGKDQSDSLALMKAFGVTMEIEVTDDKNGKLVISGQDVKFTYDKNQLHFDMESIQDDEDSMFELTEGFKKDADYTFKDDKITLKTDDSDLTFSKKTDNK